MAASGTPATALSTEEAVDLEPLKVRESHTATDVDLYGSEVIDSETASRVLRRIATLTNQNFIVVVWIGVVITFGVLRPDAFLSAANAQTIFGSQSVLVVLSLAVLSPLTAGEIDLSISGVMSVAMMTIATLSASHGIPILIVGIVVAAECILIGAANAFFVVKVGVPSIVVTLANGTLLSGLATSINTRTITGVPDSLVTTMRHRVLGLPASFYLAIGLMFAMWYVYSLTPIGRYLFFTGAGRNAARIAGVKVDRIRAGSLVASSLLCGVGAFVYVGTLGAGDPTVSGALLLPAYAAAFLGSTAVTPGRFNPLGTVIAIYFLVTGITGLQLMGYSGWVGNVFYGGSLLAAVTLSKVVADASARRGQRQIHNSASNGETEPKTPALPGEVQQ